MNKAHFGCPPWWGGGPTHRARDTGVYRGEVLRNALRPRWLALLALALVLASLCAWLGSWQLDRARSQAAPSDDAAAAEVVPLADVLGPQESLTSEAAAVTVRATGSLEPERAVRVADRELDGRSGEWLVAPLVVDGARLPVVLGWYADGVARPPVSDLPSGEVEVTGRLRISEPPVGLPPAGDALTSLSSADLLNDWGAPVYAAYLLADEPAAGLAAVPVPETGDRGLALQNLSYAVQWWVFAAFAVFIWWRVVRDDHIDRLAAARAAAVAETETESDHTRSVPQ